MTKYLKETILSVKKINISRGFIHGQLAPLLKDCDEIEYHGEKSVWWSQVAYLIVAMQH
jgi:hypothetical protein